MEKYQEGLGGARTKGEPPASQACRAQNPTWAPQCHLPNASFRVHLPPGPGEAITRTFSRERSGTLLPGVQSKGLLGFPPPRNFGCSLTVAHSAISPWKVRSFSKASVPLIQGTL